MYINVLAPSSGVFNTRDRGDEEEPKPLVLPLPELVLLPPRIPGSETGLDGDPGMGNSRQRPVATTPGCIATDFTPGEVFSNILACVCACVIFEFLCLCA